MKRHKISVVVKHYETVVVEADFPPQRMSDLSSAEQQRVLALLRKRLGVDFQEVEMYDSEETTEVVDHPEKED